MAKRVTVRDLASALGVHRSSVARALRNDRRISAALREKARSLARRLGYRPDPVLGRLSAYRSAHRGQKLRPVHFAWFGPGAGAEDWAGKIRQGFESACEELGYRVRASDGAVAGNPARFARFYRDTGLDGAFVVAPWHAPADAVFAGTRAVWFGGDAGAGLPSVHCDDFAGVRLAYARAWEAGYRRIGGAFFTGPVAERGALPVAAFLLSRHERGCAKGAVPPFLAAGRIGVAAFRGWLKRWRPDALIGHNLAFYWEARAAGWRIPRDLAYANLVGTEEQPGTAGVDFRYREIGHQAARLLDLLYKAGAVLPLEEAPRITLAPRWIEGETLPAK